MNKANSNGCQQSTYKTFKLRHRLCFSWTMAQKAVSTTSLQ